MERTVEELREIVKEAMNPRMIDALRRYEMAQRLRDDELRNLQTLCADWKAGAP